MLTHYSGVAVQQACVEAYLNLKQNEHRYVLFTVTSDLKEVKLEKRAPLGATYQDFLKDLPEDDCRYAVYNYEYDFEGSHRNKIVFFSWIPESSKIKVRRL